jgi:hypothetical protein
MVPSAVQGSFLISQCSILGNGEFDPQEHLPSKQVTSTHNTTIEGLWRWQCDADGRNIHDELVGGKDYYNCTLPFHKCALILIYQCLDSLDLGFCFTGSGYH